MRLLCLGVLVLASGITCVKASWWFTEVNWSPDPSPYVDDSIDSLDWRPQGDYALIAGSQGLYRYEYPTGPLTYQAFANADLDYVTWAPDGSHAMITGGSHLYRYEHAVGGFGSLTEVTAVQKGSTSDVVTFYAIVWNPADPQGPPYLTANYQTGSSHQIRIYRYDPTQTPYQAYWDFSGGTTYAQSFAYLPVSAAFQADGDYFVIADKSSQGIHVYDPDNSTFPKQVSGAMQQYEHPSQVGNACAVTMSPRSNKRFVLLKGNGEVQRLTQQGLPATFVWDEPGGPDMVNYAGDADYSGDGSYAIIVEREAWSPYHRIGLFNDNGDLAGGIDLLSLPNQRTLRIIAVDWHPFAPIGLIAGEDRWIIRFETDILPTPTPTAVQLPTRTPTPVPIPAAGASSTILLILMLGLLITSACSKNKSR